MKQYQFKVYNDLELEEFIENHSNVSEFLRTVLEDFKSGKLNYATLEDTKEKAEVAKLQILEAKANRIKEKESLRLRKLEAETEIIERELLYHNSFHSAPSAAARTAMKKGITVDSEINFDEDKTKNFHLKKTGADYIGFCRFCDWFATPTAATPDNAKYYLEEHLTKEHDKGLFAV